MLLRQLPGSALLAAVLVLGATGVRAAEGPHSGHKTDTIVLDNDRIAPESLTMPAGDVLVFENHALSPMRVTVQ